MGENYRGVSVRTTPFITAILAPQLKLRKLPLYLVNNLAEVTSITATYSLLDGDSIRKQSPSFKQELTSYLKTQATSIALTMERNHSTKLELLELGFHYCIEIPTATELIIKTLENNIQTTAPTHKLLREPVAEYQTNSAFSYIHDSTGRQFLVNKTKSIYLNQNEHGILEYLLRRKGFASANELAYAGWKHFNIRPNTITVTVKKLRSKLQQIALPYTIRTLYGYGYTIESKD